MSLAEFKPVALPRLGGLFTFLKPLDVPSGYSPNLQNIRFLPRAFLSRPGLQPRMVKPNFTYNGVEQYIDNSGNKTLIAVDNAGNLDFQNPLNGQPVSLMPYAANAGALMTSTTAFGRIFLSFFTPGLVPAGPTRYWNGIRQTQAPAALAPAPNIVDQVLSTVAVTNVTENGTSTGTTVQTATALGGSAGQGVDIYGTLGGGAIAITSYAENGAATAFTVTTAVDHGLTVDQQVTIVGSTTGDFDGTFTVQVVASPTQFVVSSTTPSAGATDTGGTVAPVGNIVSAAVLINNIVSVYGAADVTTETAHGLAVGQTVWISGSDNSIFNGTWYVYAVISALEFSISSAIFTTGIFASGGTMLAAIGDQNSGIGIVSCTQNSGGSIVTVVVNTTAYIVAGQLIVISGNENPDFNGVFPVYQVSGPLDFTVQNTIAPPNATANGGTLTSSPSISVTTVSVATYTQNFAGNLVTVVTESNHGLFPGQLVRIAGASAGSFDGVFTVAGVQSITSFTVVNTSPAAFATGTGGTSQLVAQIAVVSCTENNAGTKVTVVTAKAYEFQAGQSVVVSGNTVSGFNATYTILTVNSSTSFTAANVAVASNTVGTGGLVTFGNTTFFDGAYVIETVVSATEFTVITTTPPLQAALYIVPPPNATAIYGTVSPSPPAILWPSGAQTYAVQILYEINDGSFVIASQVGTWTTAGAVQPVVSNIPIGAPQFNVVARWVLFSTPSTSSPLYRFPQFRISDNVTTSETFTAVASTAAGMIAAGALTDTLVANAINITPLPHISPDGPGAPPTVADSTGAGSIVVGVHQVWVAFETASGYITALSPAGSWDSVGGYTALVTKIATGPEYVVARRLFFSSSGLANAFYLPQFRIPDNSTTSIEVNFSDIELLQGQNYDYLTKNFSITPSLATAVYNGRFGVWGGINTIKGTNFCFDGGWDQSTGAPLGWTLDPTYGAGGYKEVFKAFAGEAWRIVADGNTLRRGMIVNNSVNPPNLNMPLLSTGVAYSISFRAAADAGATAGVLTVDLYSPSLGESLGAATVPIANLQTFYTEQNVLLCNALGSIPTDLVLRVYADDTFAPVNNRVWIDHPQIYPTLMPMENSTLRFSNPFDPETFDGTNGYVYIAKDNGEKIVACSQLRSFFYVAKERSFHVTYDDGTNPPSVWLTRAIDTTIGCSSPNGLTSSESFISLASRSGAFLFSGARPQKLSQEIQTTWNNINWGASGAVHSVLDPQAKLIYFFAPMGNDSSPMNSLIMDYSEGLGQEDDPGQRKWTLDLWPQPITGSLRFENSTVTQNLFGAVPNTQAIYLSGNKVYEHTGNDDDGEAIDFFYYTAFLKAGDVGTDLAGGVAFFAEGSGQLNTSLGSIDDTVVQELDSTTLQANPGKQYELYGNLESERLQIIFQGSTLDQTCTVKGVTLYSRQWSQQRPH